VADAEEVPDRRLDRRRLLAVPVDAEDDLAAVERLGGDRRPDVMDGPGPVDLGQDRRPAGLDRDRVAIAARPVVGRDAAAAIALGPAQAFEQVLTGQARSDQGEAAARPGRLSPGAPAGVGPAGPEMGLAVAASIGLYVEDRRSVDEVEAGDPEDAAFAADELEDGQAERIGTAGRACGEDAARLCSARRHGRELGRPGPVEMEDGDDVGEGLEAVEAAGELGADLDLAHGPRQETGRGEGRRRQVRRILERRADEADRPQLGAGPYFPTYVSHFS
jgi:hypothetical protein